MTRFLLLLAVRALMFAQPGSPAESSFGSLSGRVISASSGQPMANVSVLLAGLTADGKPPGLRRSVKSAPDGTFLFTRLPAGNYAVKGILGLLGGGPSLTDTAQFTIAVRAGQESTGNQIAMRPQGSEITGSVFHAANHIPVEGATVTLTELRGYRRVLHSGVDGEFSAIIPPGAYRLVVEHQGFSTWTSSQPQVTTAGQRFTGIEIALSPAPAPQTPPSENFGVYAASPDVNVGVAPVAIDPATCPAISAGITGKVFVRNTLSMSMFGAKNPKFVRFLMVTDFQGRAQDSAGNAYLILGSVTYDFEGERSPSPMTSETEVNGKRILELIPTTASKGHGYRMVQIIQGTPGPDPDPKLPVVASTHPDGCFPLH